MIVVHALAGEPLSDRDIFRLWRGPDPRFKRVPDPSSSNKTRPAISDFFGGSWLAAFFNSHVFAGNWLDNDVHNCDTLPLNVLMSHSEGS
jgi:hypothetical protein